MYIHEGIEVSSRQWRTALAIATLVTVGFVVYLFNKGHESSNGASSGTTQAAENTNVIDLPPGEKFVGFTLSDCNAMLATELMRLNETPRTITLYQLTGNKIELWRAVREHAAEKK